MSVLSSDRIDYSAMLGHGGFISCVRGGSSSNLLAVFPDLRLARGLPVLCVVGYEYYFQFEGRLCLVF